MVQIQLTWVEANSTFLEHFPQNTVESLKIELVLLEFSNKFTLRMTTTVEKTLERCTECYKKMRISHNKCQNFSAAKIKEFLDKDQHMKNLQDRLHEDEHSIHKIEDIIKEVIKIQIPQAVVSNYLLEDLLISTPQKVIEVESQLGMHEITIRLLEPIDYTTINE